MDILLYVFFFFRSSSFMLDCSNSITSGSLFFPFKKKNIVFVYWKAITWGHPLVIAPYEESVGLTSSDSTLLLPFQKNLTILQSYD